MCRVRHETVREASRNRYESVSIVKYRLKWRFCVRQPREDGGITYPAYIRDKARQMRSERRLTIDQIAARLAISRSTVFHWVSDIEIPRKEFDERGGGSFTPRAIEARRRGTLKMQATYAARREAAYELGRSEFAELSTDPMFAQFLCLYVAEGYKRCRNRVSLGNSDPQVVLVADVWIRRFARRKMSYRLQFHADQDLGELKKFWGEVLAIEPASIRTPRKSNSNQLSGRTWRSVHGVLSVGSNDTLLRARLQGWIDELRLTWPKIALTGA